MTSRALLLAAVVGAVMLGATKYVSAGAPPPAFVRMHITDEVTVVEVAAQIGLLRAWTGVEEALLEKPGPIPLPYARQVFDGIAPALEVRVDGAVIPTTLRGGHIDTYEEGGQVWRYARIEMQVPTKVPPQQVEVVWQRYAEETDNRFEHINVELDAYERMLELRLTPTEPSFIWHRPVEMPPVLPFARPSLAPTGTLALPVLSLLVLAGALVFVVVRRRALPMQKRLSVVGVALAVGAFLLPFGRVDLRGWGGGGPAHAVERPPDDEALAIFASLHQGLYAAVAKQGEEAVYDALAPIVTAELLPRLYLETRQSMIMSAQGGAVAQIDKTDLLQSTLRPPEDDVRAPWFVVRAHWRVEGSVGHWGHTHERKNEYTADITVIAVGDRWKIAAVDTLTLRRTDDGREQVRQAKPAAGGDLPDDR